MYYAKKIPHTLLSFLILCFGMSLVFHSVSAAGNIDSVQKYSQFLSIDLDANSTNDFINWSPTNGGATVSDSLLIGYIWGNTTGWINLNPTNGGVTNSCSGILGGFAWGQTTGWINFAPSNAIGVNQPKINTTTGVITGTVWSQNYGWIQLSSSDGTYPGLTTNWRGCEQPPSATSSTTTGGSGTGQPPVIPPVVPPVVPPVIPPGDVPPLNPPPGDIPPFVNPTNPPVAPIDPVSPVDIPNNPSSENTSQSSFGGSEYFVLGFNTVISAAENIKNFIFDTVGPKVEMFLSDAVDVAVVSAPVVGALGILSSIPGLVTRFGSLLASYFMSRKKTQGVVFDANTKEPLDPVYVSVLDAITGTEIMTAISDMEGRFGFVLKQGSYKMIANKTHYAFPAQSLIGKTTDGVYDNLYFGEVFHVEDPEQVITMNIPMEAVGTDWNQEEKRRMNIMKYFLKNQKVLAIIFNVLFWIGFVLSLLAVYYYPQWWNIAMVSFYGVIAIIRIIGFGPIKPGTLTYQGSPLGYAIVRVYNANLNREVSHKVTTDLGGYYILVPKADYYITIEQKNPDNTYTKLFTSEVFSAKKGVINKSFSL